MTEAVILAFLVAKLKRFRLKPVLSAWPFYPVLFFSAVYIIMQAFIFYGNYRVLKFASLNRTLGLISFLIPVIKYRLYRETLLGAACIAAGSALNRLVIAANGGKMPVFPTLSKLTGYVRPDSFGAALPYDGLHVPGTREAKLIFLSDILDTGFGIMSIGDVLIRAYAFIITYSVIKYLHSESSV